MGRVKKYVGLTWGQYTTEQPVGEYLVTFRLKVKNNTRNKPVAEINVDAFGNLNGVITQKTLLADDFKQAGAYEDFSLRFVRPEEGKLEFRVVYLGTSDLWYIAPRLSRRSFLPGPTSLKLPGPPPHPCLSQSSNRNRAYDRDTPIS